MKRQVIELGAHWGQPRAFASSNSLPRATRHRIMTRDAFTCATCGARGGEELSPRGRRTYRVQHAGTRGRVGTYLVVDHIRPRGFGGTDDDANLRVLCMACNTSKGQRPDGWRP